MTDYDNYECFSKENFFLKLNSFTFGTNKGWKTLSPTYEYDKDTGTLTVNAFFSSYEVSEGNHHSAEVNYDIYLFKGI